MSAPISSSFADIALSLLRNMFLAREGDRREGILMRQGKGWFQLAGTGHEAIGALAYALTERDYIFPGYRDRALMHVRGMRLDEMARDFLARTGSSSEGRNLPGHFSSRRLNVFSITSPVGAQCLPAVGTAMRFQHEATNDVVLCHIGDASTRQGEFYEAISMAVQERLPIVFVVEDNHYGISTPTRRMTPRNLGIFSQDLITSVDGRDAEEVYAVGSAAIDRARRGEGPHILWCDVDRLSSHTNADDHRFYRSVAELDAIQENDPIDLLARKLIGASLLTLPEWKEKQHEIIEEVRSVYESVEQEAFPAASEVATHLYGPPTLTYPPLPSKPSQTMLQAVNRTLRAGLETDARILMLGEDIEDPKGGVFGITKGLSNAFPGRVTNSPLAEATILGTAVGLAAAGMRPVFELQFIDFIAPAFNQLVSQVANLRWRTHGEWSCPMVLYAPYGAYLPAGGMWHSQSNEGWFAHIPGIRIAVPSTPEDAAGLFWSAFHDEDPTLILLPKHLLRAEFPLNDEPPHAVPFGQARTVRSGTDVTLVAWGNCVEVAGKAADRLAAESGVSVEIIDPRTITPCDWDAIAASLARTGRLVVVQEDTRTGGFGQAILAEMTASTDRFYTLAAPPQLVARPDVPVPFNPSLEMAILPDVEAVVAAVQRTME